MRPRLTTRETWSPGRKNAHELETLEPSAVTGQSPGDAEQSGCVCWPTSVICSAELTSGGRIGRPKQSNQAVFWEGRPRYVPGVIGHSGVTQTNAREIIERRRHVGGLAFVISPPESTPRAGERYVGEEIEWSATSTAAPSGYSPADIADQAGRNRRPPVKPEKSPLFRSCLCYFPGGVDHARRKDLSRAQNLHEAPLWHCYPGYFPGGSDHVGGENTDNGR